MRRFLAISVVAGMVAVGAMATRAMAQDAPAGPPPQDGQQDGRVGRPDRPMGPGPGFHLLPRFIVEQLKLTDDQKQQVAELEKETKAKLDKILTPEQQKTLEEARPPRPGQGPGQGQGGQGAGRRGQGRSGGRGPGGQGGQDGGPGGGQGQNPPPPPQQ